MNVCWWVVEGLGGGGRGSAAGLAARGVPLLISACAEMAGRLGGQLRGGGRVWLNSVDHAVSQGQASGRCRRMRRPEDAILAGMLTSFRRIVAVVADAWAAPVG